MSELKDKQKDETKAPSGTEPTNSPSDKRNHSKNESSSENTRSKRLKSILLFTTIPVRLFAGPILGFFLGHLIDSKLNTSPIFSIGMLLLGFVLGVIQLISLSKN